MLNGEHCFLLGDGSTCSKFKINDDRGLRGCSSLLIRKLSCKAPGLVKDSSVNFFNVFNNL